MIWKKTWFSYCLWAFYTIITSLTLAVGVIWLCDRYFDRDWMVIGMVCITFLLSAGCFLGIHAAAKALKNQRRLKDWVVRLLEALGIAGGLGAGITMRSLLILHTPMQQFEQSYYLLNSFVDGSTQIPQTTHGVVFLYMQLLHTVFTFVGNHIQAAMWLQMILQIAAALLFYLGVRCLAGRAAGTLTFLGIMIAPVFVKASVTVSPFWLLACFLGLGIVVLAAFLSRRRDKRLGSVSGHLLPVLGGLLSGAVVYMDISGILLIFLGCSMLWSLSEEGHKNGRYPWGQVLEFLVTSGAVFAALCLVAGAARGIPFTEAVWEWISVYRVSTVSLGIDGFFAAAQYLAFPFIMLWGSFVFFKEKERENVSGWFLMISGWMILRLMLYSGQWILAEELQSLLFVVISGSCMGMALTGVKKNDAEKREEASIVVEDVKEIADMKETADMKTTENAGVAKEENRMKEEENKPVIKFLDNPLPVPKKHVPKTLDYDLNPEESVMKFDVEISQEDDFDI